MNKNAPASPIADAHKGQSYLVTGAASGIGRQTAQLLAAEGASLVLCDISENVLDVAEKLDAQAVVGDLTDTEVCSEAVLVALDVYGKIDGAVVAAAVVNSKTIAETSDADFRRVIEINLIAPFLLARAVIPHLRGSKNCGGFVFIGSKDAFDAVPGVAAYSVSKAALLQLAKTIAVEEGKNGIRSNVIHPDVVIEGSGLWTDELRQNRATEHGISSADLIEHYKARNALGIALSTDDMANAASFFLSTRARAITGAVLTVDGGYAPAFPR